MSAVMAVDPSSTCTGVAVVDGPRDAPVLVAGDLLRPSASLGYVERITVMVHDLGDLLDEFRPALVVVEMPDGKRHRRKGKANVAALAIYGAAAGAMLGALLVRGVAVRPAFVNESSRGMGKAERQRIVRAAFKNYRPEKDKGLDLSDAAFLALMQHRESAATAAEKPVAISQRQPTARDVRRADAPLLSYMEGKP